MSDSKRIEMDTVLYNGEEVILPFKVGEYDDGYPIFSAVITNYNKKNRAFIVKNCIDANWLIGKVYYKLGPLYRSFMNALIKKNKIQYIPHINTLKRTIVKRDNKHISINRLMEQLQHKQNE
jgi:hypothetical protein